MGTLLDYWQPGIINYPGKCIKGVSMNVMKIAELQSKNKRILILRIMDNGTNLLLFYWHILAITVFYE